MKNRLLKILESGNNAQIKEAQLAAYLQENLSEADKQALEETINAKIDGMEGDALEGWLATTDKNKLVKKCSRN